MKQKYLIYGIVHTQKYLGKVEADSVEQALDIAYEDETIQNKAYIQLCHQCSKELDAPQIDKLEACSAN